MRVVHASPYTAAHQRLRALDGLMATSSRWSLLLLPPLGITLHSVFGQSQTFQILTKHIGRTINNYETKYMQYENIFYDNSNDGYFIL
jgi:hypothetical protein